MMALHRILPIILPHKADLKHKVVSSHKVGSSHKVAMEIPQTLAVISPLKTVDLNLKVKTLEIAQMVAVSNQWATKVE